MIDGTKNTPGGAQAVEQLGAMPAPEHGKATGTNELPPPLSPATSDDLMTTLSMLSMQQMHEERNAADMERIAASKAQEAAQAEKIAKMRELANDTFAEGVVEGALGGLGAVASGAGAISSFAGSTTACKLEEAIFTRRAKLLQAGSDAFNAGSKFGGAMAKADQENDRTDIAIADAALERSKAAVESAGTDRRRADDDMRETLNAIRQYLAAKSQLANAAIIKG